MISVCIATYNGELFIEEQLKSIITNISDEDEIIISDDGSKDNTVKILAKYKEKYPFIKIIMGPGKGVIKNFENAIQYARGNYIFLSDQDDVWEPYKVKVILKQFEDSKNNVILHDASLINENGNCIYDSFYKYRKSKKGLFSNIIRNSYIGCCMAFRTELKDKILPIPSNIDMHDSWIGLIGEWTHSSVFIPDKLIRYRRHGRNVTTMKHYPLKKMVKKRIVLVYELIKRMM